MPTVGSPFLQRPDGIPVEAIVMPRLDFSWKCRDCGMTSRKEPHRRLSDHMHAAHGKVWSEERDQYVAEFAGSNEVSRSYSAPEEDKPLLPPWESA